MDENARALEVESFAAWLVGAAMLASTVNMTTVQRAIALLPADIQNSVQSVQVLAPKSNIHVNSGIECQAWVKPGDPNIYIHNWTDTYKKAEKGDRTALIRLAAAIAHEAWHQKHGPNEADAYNEQLRVLKALGAPQKDIRTVEDARAYVLKNQDGTKLAMKTVLPNENDA